MAEPLSTNSRTIPGDDPPPQANDFPGCRAVRIPLREIEDFDGRLESWGFPEVWVEVPDEPWHYRPKSRRSGLAIHVLEGGRYVEAPSSRAFPGWTAQEIHAALNEWEASLETVDVLRRVADELAAAEGTGPDNDPFLRRERAEGRAQGNAEARLEILQAAVLDAFASRRPC